MTKDTIIEVAPSEIRMPTNYVRGAKGFSEEWGKELGVIAAQSEGWPFDPLDVFRVKDDKKGRKYEVNNGAHRLYAAVKNKVKKIPVRVVEYATPGDTFAAQFVATMKSGALKLNLDARDAAIRQMVGHFKMDRKRIMELSGLSEASVSRIVSGDQRTGETGKRRGKKKKARKATKSGGGNGAFAPLDWYAGVQTLVDSFAENGEAIVRARAEVNPQLLSDHFSIASAIVSGELPANFQTKLTESAARG